jgi:ethanolamine transporter EutH
MDKLIKNSTLYGLILGGVTVAYSMITYVLGINLLNTAFSIFNFVFSLTLIGFFIFLGTKTYRDKFSEGYITYGKSLLSCLLIGIVSAVVLGIYTFVFFKTIDPAYFDSMINEFMTKIEANPQIPAETVDMIYGKMVEQFHKPAIYQALQSLAFSAISAGILGLIIGAFTKKERPLFE